MNAPWLPSPAEVSKYVAKAKATGLITERPLAPTPARNEYLRRQKSLSPEDRAEIAEQRRRHLAEKKLSEHERGRLAMERSMAAAERRKLKRRICCG
jgi:hypothetical protein